MTCHSLGKTMHVVLKKIKASKNIELLSKIVEHLISTIDLNDIKVNNNDNNIFFINNEDLKNISIIHAYYRSDDFKNDCKSKKIITRYEKKIIVKISSHTFILDYDLIFYGKKFNQKPFNINIGFYRFFTCLCNTPPMIINQKIRLYVLSLI